MFQREAEGKPLICRVSASTYFAKGSLHDLTKHCRVQGRPMLIPSMKELLGTHEVVLRSTLWSREKQIWPSILTAKKKRNVPRGGPTYGAFNFLKHLWKRTLPYVEADLFGPLMISIAFRHLTSPSALAKQSLNSCLPPKWSSHKVLSSGSQ